MKNMIPGINIFLSQDNLDKLVYFIFKPLFPQKKCKEYTKGDVLFTICLM